MSSAGCFYNAADCYSLMHVNPYMCAVQCSIVLDVGGEVDSLLLEGSFLIVGSHQARQPPPFLPFQSLTTHTHMHT